MTVNPYWSSSNASLVQTLLTSDGTAQATFANSTSTYYEYEAFTYGYLSSTDTLDFVPVAMETGSAYTILSYGSYQTSIYIFDSSGYLHLFVDGDDIGISDSYPYDSIVQFQPDTSGTYYVMIGYEYGSYSGSWQLGVAQDVGNDGSNSLLTTTTTTTTTTSSTILGSDASEVLVGTSGDDVISGYGGDDGLSGGAGSDVIYGNFGTDVVNGGDGDDTIFGGQNGGELSGSPLAYRTGNDWVYGEAGNDVLYGNHGPDFVGGGDGDDKLFGGQDNDTLSGGAGNDTLYGNKGDDLEYGGSGSDLFVNTSGNDTIADFSYAEGDRLLQSSQTTSITDTSGGALISFEDGNTVHLVGVSASSVTSAFFT